MGHVGFSGAKFFFFLTIYFVLHGQQGKRFAPGSLPNFWTPPFSHFGRSLSSGAIWRSENRGLFRPFSHISAVMLVGLSSKIKCEIRKANRTGQTFRNIPGPFQSLLDLVFYEITRKKPRKSIKKLSRKKRKNPGFFLIFSVYHEDYWKSRFWARAADFTNCSKSTFPKGFLWWRRPF